MLGVALGRPLAGDQLRCGERGAGARRVGGDRLEHVCAHARRLVRRHPIVQLTYGVALADLTVGASLAIGFLLGLEPITAHWVALKPAHAWLNVFGFVSLTIAGTLIYLYPTMLGTRIRPHPPWSRPCSG